MLSRLALTIVAALVFAAPAVAGDIGVTLGFKAGTLAVKTQTATPNRVAVTVVDARGNGKGWTLRLTGSGAPTVTRVSMRCAAGSTCTLPSGTAPAGAILAAAPGTGMGAIEIVLTVTGGHGRVAVALTA
jgi:hypothetical protein